MVFENGMFVLKGRISPVNITSSNSIFNYMVFSIPIQIDSNNKEKCTFTDDVLLVPSPIKANKSTVQPLYIKELRLEKCSGRR